MDCLDRTNVVQGVFSRYIAFYQLNKLELLKFPKNLKKNPFEKFPDALENAYRNAWSNNADVIS